MQRNTILKDGVSFWSGRRGSLAALPDRHTHAGTKTCPRHVSLASLVPCSSLCPAGKCKKTPPCRMVLFCEDKTIEMFLRFRCLDLNTRHNHSTSLRFCFQGCLQRHLDFSLQRHLDFSLQRHLDFSAADKDHLDFLF